jgi:hypothetical protein
MQRVPIPALAVDLYRAKALHYHSLTARTSLSSKERRKEKKLLAAQGKDPAVVGVDAQQKKLKWNRLDAPSWLGTSAIMWDTLGELIAAGPYYAWGRTPMNVHLTSISRERRAGRNVQALWKSHDYLGCGSPGIPRRKSEQWCTGFHPLRASRSCECATFSDVRQQANAAEAMQLARQGAYDTALCVLLSELSDLETTRITVRDVQTLQRGIYGVFTQQARRM